MKLISVMMVLSQMAWGATYRCHTPDEHTLSSVELTFGQELALVSLKEKNEYSTGRRMVKKGALSFQGFDGFFAEASAEIELSPSLQKNQNEGFVKVILIFEDGVIETHYDCRK